MYYLEQQYIVHTLYALYLGILLILLKELYIIRFRLSTCILAASVPVSLSLRILDYPLKVLPIFHGFAT